MNYDFLSIVNSGSDRRGAKVILQFFYEIGCQGDRMSYCKAFAPCLRVTEGDRRVTGMTMVFSKPPNPLKGGNYRLCRNSPL